MNRTRKTARGCIAITAAVLTCACGSEPAPPPRRAEPAPPATRAEPPRAPLAYPAAHKGDVVETLHGVPVADPHRWLEDLSSAETRAFIEAENAFTRRWFEGVPERERLGPKVAAAANVERISAPQHKGKHWFFLRNNGRQDQLVLHVADAPTAEGRPLVDWNQISPDGKLAFAGFSVSPRGTYVAYGLSQGGSDWVEWRVREVATGRDLPDRVEWTKYYGPTWAGDEKAFYYSGFPKPPSGQELAAKDLGCAVRVHRIGAPAGPDPVVYERPEHPTWQYAPEVTEDGRYLVITTGDGQVGDRGVEEVHAIDLTAKSAKPVPLAEGFDAEYLYVTSEGATFYLETSSEAPHGRVIAVDLRDPARPVRKTIVSQGKAVISSVARAGDRLLVATHVDMSSRLHAYGLDGRDAGEIALPGVGKVYPVGGGRAERAAFYVYTSFDAPATTYRLDLATGRSEVWQRPKAALDLSAYETRQVFYTSKDGTPVPMLLVHAKGLATDGNNPTYLTGYGGRGVSMAPHYNAEYAFWLSVGGVVAIPGLRGGSEYGEGWALVAEKTRKQVTFDDFIAAAEWLVAEKITSPRKLAISGASNGGLLVAAAMTQRPDLFGAVVVEVGVLDMLRFHLVGQGEGWTGVYGSPTVPEEFRALLAYSPVHNVKPGTNYPPTLVVTGENDTRVVPWHSYKFVAALQAAQAGPGPILLNLQTTSGHAGGTTLSAKLRGRIDKYGFIMKALGMTLPP
ncbi:prolyl oligopeptidase family serine peptidase [Polyangium sp. 6x1]|uniref:prolyl oligopeptidase family serine peptidase n=1 Tax=Polyangium sp. 6x1 TaxID=3042689 RepID=UPI002482C473|nr:prolyl oligopeptidase family serine peptidase [Polyangium sp. 6x1]MDI1442466.1 prolyl oligopeptidase family serine peptidase [Polyangium sp. 6x1]